MAELSRKQEKNLNLLDELSHHITNEVPYHDLQFVSTVCHQVSFHMICM